MPADQEREADQPKRKRRRSASLETVRIVTLKSGNLCAFPGCAAQMLNENDVFIGQTCHIEGAAPGGERYNLSMTDEERSAASNLMLMCYPHHQETNDVKRYPVHVLKEMKRVHEARFAKPNRDWQNRVARLRWPALVGTGIGIGLSVDALAQDLRRILDVLIDKPGDAEEPQETLRERISRCLRLAPRGRVWCVALDDVHFAVAQFFLELLRDASWEVHLIDRETYLFQILKDPEGAIRIAEWRHSEPKSGVVFQLLSNHQIPIARQAISEFFHLLGFRADRQEMPNLQRYQDKPVTFWVAFAPK